MIPRASHPAEYILVSNPSKRCTDGRTPDPAVFYPNEVVLLRI